MTRGSISLNPSRAILAIGVGLILVVIGLGYILLWSSCLRQTGGHFTYALDDAYIHLAIAKNVGFHGVWGVTEYAPASASSSPLWTCMLGLAFRIAGNSQLFPIGFAILFSSAATVVIYLQLVRKGIQVPIAAAISLIVFAIAPLLALPFTGMEHCLQIYLELLFGFWLLDKAGAEWEKEDLLIAPVLTLLICLCRYESVFLIVVPFCLCLRRRDWRKAAALALGPIAAVGGFGVYSKFSGMPFIPNSIALKGNMPHSTASWFLHSAGVRFGHSVRFAPLELLYLFLVAIICCAMLRDRKLCGPNFSLQIWLWTGIVACLLQAAFATMGVLYRYEAHLIVFLAVPIALAGRAIATNLPSKSPLMAWIPVALLLPALTRAASASADIPKATGDIYLQQRQMARFVARYYPNGKLAANDIGAVTYFSHVHLLDLVGLASDGIRTARLTNRYSTATIQNEIEEFGPDLVIVYPKWFTCGISMPANLVPVATWTIPPVTSAASPTVEFYATDIGKGGRLRSELKTFQSELPSQVIVKYIDPRNPKQY